jgi:hypothetical protein
VGTALAEVSGTVADEVGRSVAVGVTVEAASVDVGAGSVTVDWVVGVLTEDGVVGWAPVMETNDWEDERERERESAWANGQKVL